MEMIGSRDPGSGVRGPGAGGRLSTIYAGLLGAVPKYADDIRTSPSRDPEPRHF
jgi:hypothetical protein